MVKAMSVPLSPAFLSLAKAFSSFLLGSSPFSLYSNPVRWEAFDVNLKVWLDRQMKL